MVKRSYIFEEIVKYLIEYKMINKYFIAKNVAISGRGNVIKSFLYKHSNTSYKGIWTQYFIRKNYKKPLEFKVSIILLKEYELKFGLNLFLQ